MFFPYFYAVTIEGLQIENRKQRQEIMALKQQLDQLIKLINGFKSERFSSTLPILDQPTLFDIPEEAPQEPIAKEEITYSRNKAKHQGRNQLPEGLP